MIVGFADLGPDGYLDRLYVHRDWQGRGWPPPSATPPPAARITHASITARPFFERRGWHVVKGSARWSAGGAPHQLCHGAVMPAAFPPCVGRGIPDAPLLPRSGRPAPPPFFPRASGPCVTNGRFLCYDGGGEGRRRMHDIARNLKCLAAAEGADPGRLAARLHVTRQAVSNWGAEPEPARAGDTPLRGGASGGRRGRGALWSPAGGGSGGLRQTGGGARLPPGDCGPSGRRYAGLPALGAPGA